MCGFAEASAILSIVGKVAEYQAAQQQADYDEAANEQTRRNADQAYLEDLSRIEVERGDAAREKSIEQLKENQKRKGDQATGLNLGFGNPTRVVQNIGTVMDLDYNDINRGFERDMNTLNNQRNNSYANLQRTYNSLSPITRPSLLGLGLEVAGAGSSYMATPRDERRFFKDYGAKSKGDTA